MVCQSEPSLRVGDIILQVAKRSFDKTFLILSPSFHGNAIGEDWLTSASVRGRQQVGLDRVTVGILRVGRSAGPLNICALTHAPIISVLFMPIMPPPSSLFQGLVRQGVLPLRDALQH